MDILLRFDDDVTALSLVIEADSRVAYAYVVDPERIVGDVWLFNVAETPAEPPWNSEGEMPFLNPAAFADGALFDMPARDTHFRVAWDISGKHDGKRIARIFLNDILHAIAGPEWKPGYCRLAVKPGPLALPLDEF